MRWEGAAKRSEGSRAWGCKHCRGREEGIWRNRSQRWADTQCAAASANRSPPLPANQTSPLEWSTTLSWVGARGSLVLSASFYGFSSVFVGLKPILVYNWNNGVLLWLEKECCKSPRGVFRPQKTSFVPVVDSDDGFALSPMTGWISHLNEHLQRKTNGPTSPYCLFDKRNKVTCPVLLQRDWRTLREQIKSSARDGFHPRWSPKVSPRFNVIRLVLKSTGFVWNLRHFLKRYLFTARKSFVNDFAREW